MRFTGLLSEVQWVESRRTLSTELHGSGLLSKCLGGMESVWAERGRSLHPIADLSSNPLGGLYTRW
jgi:hypothetical protein